MTKLNINIDELDSPLQKEKRISFRVSPLEDLKLQKIMEKAEFTEASAFFRAIINQVYDKEFK